MVTMAPIYLGSSANLGKIISPQGHPAGIRPTEDAKNFTAEERVIMEKKRSIGVTILGYFYILGCSYLLSIHFKGIVNAATFNRWLSYAIIQNPDILRIVLWVGLFLQVLGITIAFNILALKELARKTLIFYCMFQLLYSLLINHFFWSVFL